MAVRRLNPEQPPGFAFTAENLAWAKGVIAKYPEGKQASAIIPLLWRAQEQSGGWLSEPAIRSVCDMLEMAHIRGLEVATFYTMFQLAPVGSKAHVQVCGTTPCMLRGSGALVEVCKKRIAPHAHELNGDATLSWEEVECLGSCANAPLVQIGKDTFEDLTPLLLEAVIDGFVAEQPPVAGSQIGRTASCPTGGATTLLDPSLFDGSTVGAWKKRFDDVAKASALPTVAKAGLGEPVSQAPPIHPGALAAMANAGLVKELNDRGSGKPLSTDHIEKMKSTTELRAPQFGASAGSGSGSASGDGRPELLDAPRAGKGDDLGLIWGVADKLAEKLNALGIWHFDQIAAWTPANVAWFEAQLDGFKGRIARDKWIEQAQKLAGGWRPGSDIGERPKG